MDNQIEIFEGADYNVWGFVLSHICALILYNYEHNHAIRFGGVGYWECKSYLRGSVKVRTTGDSDVKKARQRGVGSDSNGILVLSNRENEYLVECQEFRFANLGTIRPSYTNQFLYDNRRWKRLWFKGEVQSANPG